MNIRQNFNQFPLQLKMLFIVIVFNRIGTMAFPFLTIYLAHLKVSLSQIGFTLCSFGVGATIVSPLSGWLSGRINVILLLLSSLFLTGLCLFVYPYLINLNTIAFITFFWGFSNEMFKPVILNIITSTLTKNKRKLGFAYNRLAINFGMSIGPLIGGFLATKSFHLLFIVNSLISFTAAFMLIVFSIILINKNKFSFLNCDDSQFSEKQVFNILEINYKFIIFLLVTSLVLIVFYQCDSTFSYYSIKVLNNNTVLYGIVFTINTILVVLFEIPINTLMLELSAKRAIIIGIILIFLGFSFLGFVHNLLGIILSVSIWTVGEIIFFPAAIMFISDITKDLKKGIYLGFYNAANNIALIIAPVIGMHLFSYMQANFFWFFISSLSLIAAVIFNFIF